MFLQHFERTAVLRKWDRSCWAVRLAPLLGGKAKEAYLRLQPADAQDYDILKDALLRQYCRTSDYYQGQFRQAKKSPAETFVQFLGRIKTVLLKWMSMEDCNHTDAKQVFDFFLKEQLLGVLNFELQRKVKEAGCKTAEEVAKKATDLVSASAYFTLQMTSGARPKTQYTSSGHVGQNQGQRSQKDQESSQVNEGHSSGQTKAEVSRQDRPQIVCFRCDKHGHKAKDCRVKLKAVTSPVRSDKGKEGRVTLKAVTLPVQRDDIPSLDPKCQVKINGQDCVGLRDTGASVLFVKKSLVRPDDLLGQTIKVELADMTVKTCPLAYVDLECDYVSGRAIAVAMDQRPDIYIGNTVRMADGTVRSVQFPISPPQVESPLVQAQGQTQRTEESVPLHIPQIEKLGLTPQQFSKAQETDPTLNKSRERARSSKMIHKRKGSAKFKVTQGILKRSYEKEGCCHTQLCVPKSLRVKVMSLAHKTPLGHLDKRQTREKVYRDFYWPGMQAEIKRFCASCDKCKKNSIKRQDSKVPLEHMPLSHRPGEEGAINSVSLFKPASRSGCCSILVMADYLSRKF